MTTPLPPGMLEPTPQQVTMLRIVWFGMTIGSTLLLSFVFLQVFPNMDLELPRLQLAPRELMVGGVAALSLVMLVVARIVRERFLADPPPRTFAPVADPVQRMISRLNATNALIAGLLDAPFIVALGLSMVSGLDPMLIGAGAAAPLLGGLLYWPDPVQTWRELGGGR